MMIVKLGGSALTIKDAKTPTVDDKNLNRIAKEVSNYTDDMIIVHGAGSFGHILAKKYQIGNKITNEEDNLFKIEGLSLIQSSMQSLNYKVVTKLQENNVPAIGIKPSSFILTKNQRITICDTNIVKKYVDEGFVPVIYGDAVLDLNDDIKFAIISGDQLITYFSKALHADKVILSSDVDGIYTDNPKTNPDAKLLDVVTKDTQLTLTQNENQADVTGGMAGKIKELLKLADEGIESIIINAEKEGNLEAAVSGQNVKGTVIKQ